MSANHFQPFTQGANSAAAIIQTLDSLHLNYPEVGPDKLEELAAAEN